MSNIIKPFYMPNQVEAGHERAVALHQYRIFREQIKVLFVISLVNISAMGLAALLYV